MKHGNFLLKTRRHSLSLVPQDYLNKVNHLDQIIFGV